VAEPELARGNLPLRDLLRCLLTGLVLFFALECNAAPFSYPLSFDAGWNLAGNPLTTAIDVQKTFATQAAVQSVWKWDAGASRWALYAPSLDAAGTLSSYAATSGYSVLASIAPGEGYWVHTSQAVSLGDQSGTAYSLEASALAAGWNLAATADNLTPATLAATLKGITTLWAWDNADSTWYFYAPSLAADNTLASYIQSKGYKDFGTLGLGQGRGFWVNTVGALGSFSGNIVLGVPTQTSIKANVFSPDQGGSVYIAYGSSPGNYTSRTDAVSLTAGSPVELSLGGLIPDTRYYYRLFYQASSGSGPTAEYSFHTARPAGSTFTFAIQGDSHPERAKTQFDANLYTRTLLTAATDNPDFYITIGDDFSVDQLDPKTISAALVTERYTLQRPYLGLIGRTAPIFLTNGNHEQAARYLLDGTANNVAVWAQNARNAHYSQPASDGFYTGNTEQIPHIGLLRNYYAWTWGDALFVVIDPYWESPICVDDPFGGGPKRTNLWDITHGDPQYQWLKSILTNSQAKYKFVFAHHVMGTGRGGIELAGEYEWGGQNGNGTSGFATNRPNWSSPIHQLMADKHVTIFFQGHDHIWVRQQLDGVTYQTLSEPADPNYSLFNADAYLSGDKFPNTGYTRVNVSPAGVKVEYVRTYLPADEGPGKTSGSVAFSYTIP
jgi:Calcineurin-like phosphoesterase